MQLLQLYYFFITLNTFNRHSLTLKSAYARMKMNIENKKGKRGSNMKKNKRKTSLKSTLLLLLLTAILLITSSYAWFTSNKTVTVSTIEVNVAATNGLQISTDAQNWKSIITVDEIKAGYTDHKNQLPAVLQPVSTDGTVVAGYMNMFLGTVTNNESTGAFELSSTKETEAAGTTGNFIAFDIFLKVDTQTDVYLTSASGVKAKNTSVGLENAARIAFVNEGHLGNGNAVTSYQKLNGGTTSIIWEPNNNAHTNAAISHAFNTYGQTINATSVVPNYLGIKAQFSKIPVNDTTESNFATVTPTLSTGTVTPVPTDAFVTLEAGVTKFRVYMWVEGQDVDCENGASGSDIAFDLQFSIDKI